MKRLAPLAYVFRHTALNTVAPSVVYLLLLCLFLCAALRNQSFGLPESWASDEISWIVDGMLASHSLNPHYFLYPSLSIYLAYIPSRLVTWLWSDMDGVTRQYMLGTICRSVSALAFLGTCIAIERLCAQAFGIRAAFFALVAVGLNGALVHHAHLGTVNSVFFLSIALALYCLVRATRTGRIGDVYLAAAICGLAVGAKYNALFLYAGLPLAYVLKSRPFKPVMFIAHMVASSILSVVMFILTTPYILFAWPEFRRNMSQLVVKEGPAFKTPMSFENYLWKVWTDCLGFFSPLGLYIVLGIALVGLAVCLGDTLREPRRALSATTPSLQDVCRIELLLVELLGTFLVMNYFIGIFQSRYSIPGAMLFLCSGLIGWYTLNQLARPWSLVARVTLTFVLLPLLFVFGLNTYVQVEAFSHSAKRVAEKEMRMLVTADRAARIGVLQYPNRSPFALGAAEGRIDVFMTMVADYDVNTWDEYLQIIASYFKARSPKYIVVEDIVLAWPVFLPKRYATDYSKRLEYPNPGPDAWNRMFGSIGYTPKMTIAEQPFPEWVYAVLGTWYRVTVEGVGTTRIIVYER
jgi:hypothetical protein